MKLILLVLSVIALLAIAYRFYGRLLARVFNLSPNSATPAQELNDGVDYVPTNKIYLLGQHLSAIAAAGPIVGPILAGMWFGWLPALAWIILGSIFIGGAHDFSALVTSVRNKGKSVAEVVKSAMPRRAYIVFQIFLWLSIIYIITAFTDITAGTFVEAQRGGAVASSSMFYLLTAGLLGLFLRHVKLSLKITTLVSVPLVLACIFLGRFFPIAMPFAGFNARVAWDVVLLSYCFIASVIPVWLLLQPRGYLGGFFLSFTAVAAFIGIIICGLTGRFDMSYPMLTGWVSSQGFPLVPLLFTTVACGACSGFHAIVSSGTSSKQLAKETDARIVGYGGMLLEAFVALIALCTVIILSKSGAEKLNDPNQIYASGIASFFSSLGIEREFALNFALLAFATFVYDTLDVATRLGRYIFQELCGLKGKAAAYLATAATLLLPFMFVTRANTDTAGNQIPAWKAFWTIFGSSNQLLAALAMLGISVWMFRKRMKFHFLLWPAVFMLMAATGSILLLLKKWFSAFHAGTKSLFDPIAVTCFLLLALTMLLVIDAVEIFFKKQPAEEACPVEETAL